LQEQILKKILIDQRKKISKWKGNEPVIFLEMYLWKISLFFARMKKCHLEKNGKKKIRTKKNKNKKP
jgi:hypothetical protein